MPESRVVATKEEAKYYPFTGLYKYVRESFWTAGQDSYTKPPAQDPDMFLQLVNTEPVTQGILQRRRGYTLFSNQSPVAPFTLSYAFRNETLALRRIIWSSASDVLATDESGTTILDPIFTPSLGASAPRMVLSRNFGYFADGVAADYNKWDGTTGASSLTKWGIDINSAVSSVGPDYAGTASDVGDHGHAWTNVNNILGAPNSTFTSQTVTTSIPANTNSIKITNYGFALGGGSKITGIQVTVTLFNSAGGGSNNCETATVGCIANLVKGGTVVGSSRCTGLQTAGSTRSVIFGGQNDLWGVNWASADINASNFGAQFYCFTNKNNTFQADAVGITVFLAASPLTVGAPVGGSITLISGRTYFYAFQNSLTGQVSSLSPASNSTGAITSKNIPLSAIPTSTDPQVDTVLLLATADGNDQTTLFLLGTVTVGTTTFTDSTTDGVLLTQPVFQQTDSVGQLHGVANNNPPPVANFPVKHKGRIYMAQGHNIYFSKSLDDVTTSTGTITGKWEESWPFTNAIDLSEYSETVKALLSDGETLWIATERNIRRLIGDGPLNFQKPEIQFNETGVLSPEVWKVVFAEGQPVGTMWLTPDLRVMESDFNTYRDVGTPIQDVLNSINPLALTACHAVFYSKQAFDLFMLHIPTGGNTVPDTVCVYNLRTKKWSIWNPTDQISTSVFNIDINGNPQWLFGSAAGPLYFWDSTTLQDRTGGTPVSYPVTMQTSWLDLGDFTWWKVLNLQIVTSDDLALTLAIDGAVTNSDFLSPTQVLSATTVTPSELRSYLQVPLSTAPARHWWLRFTWVSPPSTIQNVLTSHNTEVIPYARF